MKTSDFLSIIPCPEGVQSSLEEPLLNKPCKDLILSTRRTTPIPDVILKFLLSYLFMKSRQVVLRTTRISNLHQYFSHMTRWLRKRGFEVEVYPAIGKTSYSRDKFYRKCRRFINNFSAISSKFVFTT